VRQRGPVGPRKGTLFVLEEDPPSDRPRWYCHWDGDDAPGFVSVDDAVSWGMERVMGVVVRTVRGAFYLAGEHPHGWGSDIEFSPWPPSPAERDAIDSDYAVAVHEAAENEAAWRTYEQARRVWLRVHRPELPTEPVHECVVRLWDSDEFVSFEEFDFEGRVCGALVRRVPPAFGSADHVLAAATGRTPNDEWVQAVVTALDRDRNWEGFGRRDTLEVRRATGEMFHVSASRNRLSIEHHGLDWRRMSEQPGVAGARAPELEALFLCESHEETAFFTDMSRVPSDVWAVDVTGQWLENGPSGWVIVTDPVPPEAVRLVARDVRSQRPR
jgi:hypothetical protein